MTTDTSAPAASVRPAIAYRAIRPSDAEAIAAMQSLPGVRAGTLRPPYVSPERVRKWIEGASERQTMLGAWLDGALVALGDVTAGFGRRAHVGSLGLCVHDDWVGRGIGGSLLDELLTIADRWLGLRRVELTVYTDNAPAIALYRRRGFEIEGTHRGYALRDGVYVDAYSMARHATPGSG